MGGQIVWVNRAGAVFYSRIVEKPPEEIGAECVGLTEADMIRDNVEQDVRTRARELDTSSMVPNRRRPIELYKPEQHFTHVKFHDQLRRIDRMGATYRHLEGNTPPAEAFRFAFDAVYPELSVLLRLTDDQFYDSFRDNEIRWAGRDIGDMLRDPLGPLSTELSRHTFERVCLDPAKLLLAATETPMVPKRRWEGREDDEFPADPDETDHGDLIQVLDAHGRPVMEPAAKHSIEYRKYWGCRLRLAIALQYLNIGLIDPDEWSSEDLLNVDELSNERVFLRGADRTIWILARLDARKKHRVCGEPRMFLNQRPFNTARRKAENGGNAFHWDRFLCRVAQVNGKRFYIWVDSRWKEKRSTLLKVERGRALTDRRGWKYVVVAVEERGHLRVGTLADATEFARYTMERLWVGELVLGTDEGGLNPSSNEDYHDVKVVGRIIARYGTSWVSAQCEQLVLGLKGHLNTFTSDDSLNHDIYRGQQIVEFICPKWLPFATFRIGWPKFPKKGKNVTNGTPEKRTMERLLRWWRSRARNARA